MKPYKMALKALPWLLAVQAANASIPLAPRMGAGGKMDMFGCMLSNDFYIANFAAYQKTAQQAQNAKAMLFPLCQEIPKIGETQITVDMLDRDVRHKAVALKLFDSDQHLLTETPAKVLGQGYISTTVNFPKPGHYDLVAYVDDQDLKVASKISALHIPLTVAIAVPGPSASAVNFLSIALGVGTFAVGLGVLVPRLMKPDTKSI